MTTSQLPSLISSELLGKLELLRMHTRRQFFGQRQGRHLSLRKGLGIEFADYRKYELGDNPRHIDWGMYGRSDKLYVKTFKEEEDISILIVLDGSASMRTSVSGQKWERAQSLAMSLAYVGLLGRDRVSVHIPGVLETSFVSHPSAIYQLASQLASVEFKEDAHDSIKKDFRVSLERLRSPGLLFFLSDFLFGQETLTDLVKSVQGKNVEASFFAVLADEDLSLKDLPDDFVAEDSEFFNEVECARQRSIDEEYEFLSTKHFSQISEGLHDAGIRFSMFEEKSDLSEYLFQTLPPTGIFSV